MVKQIKKEELRKMHDREGLVLQGCGGDLKEWVDGINETLEQEGILPKGKRLDDVAFFRNGGSTNLLFFFGEEKLDIGKLAVWRLKTHPQFGGTWMSDYVNNRLGGFLREDVAEKPNCALIGEDGNIFNLMGIVAHTGLEGTESDNTETEEPEVVVRTETGSTQGAEEVLPPQTDKEEQKLQEEVTKPEEVPEEVLHDPTRKPDGEIVEGEPVAEEHEEGTRPEEPVIAEGTPQAGDTSGGQIYIPGFGWVENQGGGASGTTAGDMYENGNKIGSMD